ncbi:hypothetical protein Rt10032_c01g0070 [Rhodotorula toruloides]|uniref:Uncharacterized protein n=1 Tax=Rhodotorula toruloides TaxID=5286 RepID=A0A511K6T9_RHOTO|nr:hypothetical protein Rt10032_c01g0070 [Rhodotorula toruloides]
MPPANATRTQATPRQPRSSSLSALSSHSSSPVADVAPASPSARHETPPFHTEEHDSTLDSPASTATARPIVNGTTLNGKEFTPEPKPSSFDPARDDSLSELEPSADEAGGHDDDAGESSEDEPLLSRSATSTPAPSNLASPSQSPAPKRRGRPPGSKNKQYRMPLPRSQRASLKAAASAAEDEDKRSPEPSGSNGGGSGSSTPAPARATRANVTLPPGYIWGVTSNRWPKKREKDDEGASLLSPTPAESRAGSVSSSVNGMMEHDGMEEQEEEEKPIGMEEGGKERVSADVAEDVPMKEETVEPVVSVAMSRETSLDEGSVTPARMPKGKGKGKGKGKRGKKELPEPIERAKRRKLDTLDEDAAERHAARESARLKFLDQLEDELRMVEERTHPLLELTYNRLREEKALKLEQLKRYHEERERELGRLMEARLTASWRQWADRKDRSRMDLYLENHSSLKSVIAEERIYPFFRDHPLFLNQHDLPPTGYYRGPQRDPAFVPREILHAGHYVEPPPLNPALGHNAWKLSAEEIEADLALFHEIEDEPLSPHSAALQPPPPVGMYTFPPPPYYYDTGAPLAPPVPPLAGPYLSAPGFPPPMGAMPPPHMAPYPSFYPGPPPPMHPSQALVSPDEKVFAPPTAHPAQPPPHPSFPSFGHQPACPPREAVPASFAQPSPPVKVIKSPKVLKSKPGQSAMNGLAANSAAPTSSGPPAGSSVTNGDLEGSLTPHSQTPYGSSMSLATGYVASASQPPSFSAYSALPKSPSRPPAMLPPSAYAAAPAVAGQIPPADNPRPPHQAGSLADPPRFSPPVSTSFAPTPNTSASAPPALAPYSFPPPLGSQKYSSNTPLAPFRQPLFPSSLPTPSSNAGSTSPSNGSSRISPNLAPPKLPSLSHPHRSPPRQSPRMSTALPPLFPPASVPGVTKTSPLLAPLGKTDASVPVGPATGLPLPSWLKPLNPPQGGGGSGANGAGQPKLPHEARPQHTGKVTSAGVKPYWG